jgi:hypothetical protein
MWVAGYCEQHIADLARDAQRLAEQAAKQVSQETHDV